MKKLIIALVLIALPISLFAQFFIGPTAFYKGSPVEMPTIDQTFVDQLSFGVDTKIQLSILEIQGMALYNLNQSFNCYLDAGIVLDIAVVSLGAGIGPNFLINFAAGAPEAFGFGFNGKIHADINIDIIKISVYYMFLIDSISSVDGITANMYAGNIGLSVLFKL